MITRLYGIVIIVALTSIVVYPQQPTLIFPGLLEKSALEAGNPLATYSAMVDLEEEYKKSKIFAGIYPEIRGYFEEFMGIPDAGKRVLSAPPFKRRTPSEEKPVPAGYGPRSALRVIEAEAAKTRAVIYGEEHHLPETRSLYEGMLRTLWKQGYRYLAAESFDDSVMSSKLPYPTYSSGLYTLDPIYASAYRVAHDLGYKLIPYDTKEQGPAGDQSFRDRTQAENIKKRVFDLDPTAKVIVFAGRAHAAEVTASDGWTPMASVFRKITGINPFTIYTPAMSERLTREDEEPFYRYATANDLVKGPTIFVSSTDATFGSESFDAYIFWPRLKLEHGRPAWMRTTLGRKPVIIPAELIGGQGTMLVQAFRKGEPTAASPVDQIMLQKNSELPRLMLPRGRFWLRSIDRHSNVLGTREIRVN